MIASVARALLLFAPVALVALPYSPIAEAHREGLVAFPRLPGAETPPSDAAADVKGSASSRRSPQQLSEHIRRGVVALERGGVPLAIGTVLDGDGRILTSLSGLGGTEGADVRYADGTTVHAKISSGDKASDLALLVPPSHKWTEGLAASESDPVGAQLSAMLPAKGSRLGPAEAGVKGRVDTHASDGAPLPEMLDVDVKGPLVAGAPILDAAGSVVAVLVRACKGPAAAAPDAMPWAAWGAKQRDTPAKAPSAVCTSVVVGAPVSSIRSFLGKVPPAAKAPAAWLGIRGETAQAGTVRGVRVIAVAPAGPAQEAGLRVNSDVIVAADGAPIDTPEALATAVSNHAAGETVKLLVFGADKFREVAVVLRTAP